MFNLMSIHLTIHFATWRKTILFIIKKKTINNQGYIVNRLIKRFSKLLLLFSDSLSDSRPSESCFWEHSFGPYNNLHQIQKRV